MKAMGRIGASLGCVAVMAIAGCGAQPTLPTAPKRPRPTPPSQVIGVPGYPQPGQPGMPGQPGAANGQAQALLTEMGRAVSGLRSASYQGILYCRGSFGNKPKSLPNLNGEWEATSHYQVDYKRPEAYRIEVTKCTNTNSVGMKIVIHQNQAQVKLPGLLGMVKFDFTLDSKEMKNFRGHRLDVGSISGLAKRFATAPVPEARLVGEMAQSGRMLDLVEITRTPDFDRTIVKELIGVDRQSRLPLLHAMYTSQRKVYEMKIPSIRQNGTVREDFDEL